MLKAHERTILQHVATNGPCSCKSIADATGIKRELVYRFLYKARCSQGPRPSDNGKGWIDNLKDRHSNGPGEYTITPAGQALLQQ